MNDERLLVGKEVILSVWRDPSSGIRVGVTNWIPLSSVGQQFFEREKSVRLLWNYWRQIGTRVVWRKVRSRLAESERNKKITAIGSGVVLEAPSSTNLSVDDPVIFYAPNHPQDPSQIVVDKDLVLKVNCATTLSHVSAEDLSIPTAALDLVGWTPYSGIRVDRSAIRNWLELLWNEHFSPVNNDADHPLNTRHQHAITRINRPLENASMQTAVLFGLGNYAKTQIVPNIRRRLQLACIHEIDVAQIRTAMDWGVSLDTSPMPRDDEHYDAWFIAGFHHHHADIAVTALEQGAFAIVEKPLATTEHQLNAIRKVLKNADRSRLITCFQRRYSAMNNWARQDMNITPDSPINYHCIVYEVPLPRRHWYNWPTSQSRITSNGCHWIDHFLFLNGYAPVLRKDLFVMANGDYVIVLELSNDAYFSMTLTQHGSERLGVRDYVELRYDNVTVQMIDQRQYRSESSSRIIRKKLINPMSNYSLMYRTIVGNIVQGHAGDSEASLLSASTVLELEDRL